MYYGNLCNIDVHGVILRSNRSFYVVGESLQLQCNTTPPDLPVMWEKYTVNTNGFVSLANDMRTSFTPTDNKTFATLANITLSDSGDYECFGAIPQLASIRRRANDIFVLKGYTLFLLLCNYKHT